jgi:hypothetical protein
MSNNKFKPIVTDKLKLEVQLQTPCSSGIIEWRSGS